jgi:hypothetical protein
VLHKCDNAGCVNAAHLFEGTRAHNIADMFAKNRQSRRDGEFSNSSKLTDREVLEIRTAAAAGETYTSIAVRFGCTRQNISHIVNRRSWLRLNGSKKEEKAP